MLIGIQLCKTSSRNIWLSYRHDPRSKKNPITDLQVMFITLLIYPPSGKDVASAWEGTLQMSNWDFVHLLWGSFRPQGQHSCRGATLVWVNHEHEFDTRQPEMWSRNSCRQFWSSGRKVTFDYFLATLLIAPFTTGQMNVENIDVFCEKGVFEIQDSQRILEVADMF